VSNPKEGYAFITNGSYDLYAKHRWSYAVSIGDNYKLITFAKKDEPGLIELTESLGFEAKHLSAQSTIDAMDILGYGPFVVYGQDVHIVINYFNPVEE